ncbi:MAG: hypothetical protein JO039_17000, partial [Solirubrobacterales bacterium]|nr:hypothetical protein [Solirubrobacterales bacterium]
AVGQPLAEAPDASERALRQAERAIAEMAEHHAHVRLRPLLTTHPTVARPPAAASASWRGVRIGS